MDDPLKSQEDLGPFQAGKSWERHGAVYFNYPLGTPMCMRDGLFCTGDVGDEDLEIKNGSKHVIICVVESIRSVENISSVEIESVLYTHPAVNWTDVVPRRDEFWSKSPCAFVSLKHGLSNGPGEKDMIDYCREKMGGFQRLDVDGKIIVPALDIDRLGKKLVVRYAKICWQVLAKC
ncbi:hypothetical protein SADUNF_Sadunf04G0106000 [Salix dunnii]|uniref:AMP-binding enzyme C-terminal domain-containing protein n=1 Tax=Salix dunnii TaxID=1413687 RepID=A0A835N0W2_9ROSI|nr:hypothetical protein SADUNF_Sadunf04G0106000 [Salix dunnii]